MSTQLPRKVLTQGEELITLLQFGLPELNLKLWYTVNDFQHVLKTGGFPLLPDKSVLFAFRRNKDIGNVSQTRSFRKKIWYCFVREEEAAFDTPAAQCYHLDTLKKKKLLRAFAAIVPPLPPNHFASYDLKFLKKYRSLVTTDVEVTATPQMKSANAEESVMAPDSSTPVAITPSPSALKQNRGRGNRSDLPLCSPDGKHIGLVFAAIGKNSEVIKLAEDHARECTGNNTRLDLTRRWKMGFEMFETHACRFCKKEYTIKSGPNKDPNTKNDHCGQQPVEINKIIGHAAHGAGLTQNNIAMTCDLAGCVRPSDSGLAQIYKR